MPGEFFELLHFSYYTCKLFGLEPISELQLERGSKTLKLILAVKTCLRLSLEEANQILLLIDKCPLKLCEKSLDLEV